MSAPFRRPTSQAYGLRPTSTSAPTKRQEEELTVTSPAAPSYKFADKQQGSVDTEAEQRDREDEKIRENQGKNPDDVEQPETRFVPKKKQVLKNDKSDRESTQTTVGSNVFEAFWSRETDYDLEEVTFTAKNTWTPYAQAMFEILDACHIFVTESRVVAKHHPRYLDYGVVCYYSIIFYIQILRAQLAAGLLTGEDASFFRRFDRKFRPEELPISQVLVPFFSSITACLLPDSKYSWIVPTYAPGLFSTTMASFARQNKTIRDGGIYLQPMVPFMLSILRTAITPARRRQLANEMSSLGGGDANNHDLMFFNDRDQYISRRLSDHHHTDLFGMRFQNGQGNHNDGRDTMFWACGISHPFNADYDTLSNASPKWNQSSFSTLRETDMADGSRQIHDLQHFLHMEKNDDMEWFRELVLQAGIHARFFGDVQTLSDIPTVGGLETLISCQHKKGSAAAPINFRDVYLTTGTAADPVNHVLANGTEPWYPRTFKDTVGSFYTTRNGYKRQEVLQAMTFAINSTIYVGLDEANHENERVGETEHYRVGPYWNNKEWTATRFAEAGQIGKPMFAGWRELIQTTFAQVKPTNY